MEGQSNKVELIYFRNQKFIKTYITYQEKKGVYILLGGDISYK